MENKATQAISKKEVECKGEMDIFPSLMELRNRIDVIIPRHDVWVCIGDSVDLFLKT